MTPWIVVFGSVMSGDGGIPPADIDFVYGGGVPASKADYLVRQAFPQFAHLPLDEREQYTAYCTLPAPCGHKGPYRILQGNPEVRWQNYGGIASIIRAYGDDAATAVAVMEGASKGHGLELAIFPFEPSLRWGGWDSYTQGPTALRSARRHASAWKEIVKILPFGPLLDRLCREEPRPTDAELIKELRQGSPAASGVAELLLRYCPEEGWSVGTEYGRRLWEFGELEGLLFPAVPVPARR